MDNAVRCQQWEPCTNCPSSTLLRVTANPGGNVCASFIQKFSRCCLTLFWLLYMASFDGEHLYVMPFFLGSMSYSTTSANRSISKWFPYPLLLPVIHGGLIIVVVASVSQWWDL